jgi:hypothetical protein
MKKIDLGQTITILANVGVITGIVFLAVELNQNNALLESEARATRVQIRSDAWNRLAQSPEIVALLVKDRGGEALSEEEELRLNAYWMTSLFINQWQHEELTASTEWIIPLARNFAAYGSLRRTWQGTGIGSRSAGKDNFSADFVRIMDEQVVARP